jgi:hypothetical protein
MRHLLEPPPTPGSTEPAQQRPAPTGRCVLLCAVVVLVLVLLVYWYTR